jgi:hypothetical protein
MTQLFLIPAETATRFTRSQREWVKTKCATYRTYGAVEIDLDELTMHELYNLDRILNWTEKNWVEQKRTPLFSSEEEAHAAILDKNESEQK